MAATGYNVQTTADTISFRDQTTGIASISYDHSTETLTISHDGTGAISFGDSASDVFIGDGENSVDLIFEVDGAVKGETDVTLTLGATDSDILIASPVATITGSQIASESWVGQQGYITTDTNTTYSAGTHLTLNGTTFNVDFATANKVVNIGHNSTNNEGEIILDTSIHGSPQISFTEHGDASWAIGIDDDDNSFKIHGSASSTIPTINALVTPLFEITTAGLGYLGTNRLFADNYHPNADTLTTARTIAGTSFNGSANIDISYNNLTNKPTIPTNNNQLTNGAGYITAVRTVTAGGNTLGASETLAFTAGSNVSISESAGAVTINSSHPTISAASSSNNSGRTYIQDITLDSNGHVTAIATATETVTDTNTTYSAGNGISLSGTTFSVAAGSGLTQTSTGLSHTDTSSQASVNNSNGTVIQDITLDTYGHITAIGSANLDSRYYTETEINTYFNRGYITHQQANNLAVGWYTIAQNTGDRALGEFQIWDTNSGKHQSIIFNAAHHFGQDDSNSITVLANSSYSTDVFRYIRIKENSTYDGAAIQIYIDNSANDVHVAIVGANAQESGWVLVDWLADATAPSEISNWSSATEKSKVDLDNIHSGGIATTGKIYSGGATTQYEVLNTNSAVNASKITSGTLPIARIADDAITGAKIAHNTLDAIHINASAVGASELNVSGNGTTSQFLRSDGDGTFSWATPTDTNTTYSAGNGLLLSGTQFKFQDPSNLTAVTESNLNLSLDYIHVYTDANLEWNSLKLQDLKDAINTNTTYSAGTGITLTGTTFSLTDTNSKLNLSGGTMTGSLQVSVDGANGINIKQDTSDENISGRLFFSNNTSGQGVSIYNGDNKMMFQTGATYGSSTGTTRMTILSSGNVGIGTTSPSEKLDVVGNVEVSGTISTGGTPAAEVGSWLHVGRQWSFSGLPYFNKTGGTARRLDGAFMTDLATTQAASQRVQAVFGPGFNDISGYSGAGTDYSRALGASIKAGFFITGQNSAKVIFAVGLASTSGVYADADPISNYGFGVEFRRGSGSVYEWRVFGHNGTSLSASSWSSSGITYSTDPRTIAIYSDGSGNITAYTAMYGDTNYTTITTTGGPTASSGTSTSTNMVGLRCNTNASGYVTGAYAKARASAVNFYAE